MDRKSPRTSVNRRQLLQGSLAASVAASIHNAYGAAPPQAAPAADAPFSPANVRDMARARAAKPYVAPDESLPDALTKLTYDQYRSIRFRPDHALWHGENRGFEAQFFHRGSAVAERGAGIGAEFEDDRAAFHAREINRAVLKGVEGKVGSGLADVGGGGRLALR